MKLIKKSLNYLRLTLRHQDLLEKYNNLKKNQYLEAPQQEKEQLLKLNKLLTHAFINVPYYHQLFKSLDIVHNDKVYLAHRNDLWKIPLLDKSIIRQEKEAMYSDDMQNRIPYKNSSGGSTGEPLQFMQDAYYALSNKANTQLAYFWRDGYEPYDDMVILWGAERDTFEGKKPLKSKLKEFYQNILILNSFNMTEELMRSYIKILNREQPKLIRAYTQSIIELAKFAKKNKLKVQPQNAIHLAAGTVYESTRQLVEEIFSCKAYNYYGSRDVGSIASECSEQNGLHIMMEHTLVEVLNEKGEACRVGEEGEIVVTTLENYSMPLIRYKIGDVGVLKADEVCSCGCGYAKLEKIVGRTTDIFKTASGAVVAPEYFIHLVGVVANRGNIKLFQVIQKSLDKIVVKIVKEGEIKEEDLAEIKEKIEIVMGSNCSIIFDFVEDIPKTSTGKYRYTISQIGEQ